MRIVIVGFGVFVTLMAVGIVGARVVGVPFDGGGYGALFLLCVVAGVGAATAKAVLDEERDR